MQELTRALEIAAGLLAGPTSADGWRKVQELYRIRDRVVDAAGEKHLDQALRFRATVEQAWSKYRQEHAVYAQVRELKAMQAQSTAAGLRDELVKARRAS